MGKSVKLTCDCGCGESTGPNNRGAWFKLSQERMGVSDCDPKLDREVFFSSIACVARWAEKASRALPAMQEKARSLSPRGTFSNQNVSGLTV